MAIYIKAKELTAKLIMAPSLSCICNKNRLKNAKTKQNTEGKKPIGNLAVKKKLTTTKAVKK